MRGSWRVVLAVLVVAGVAALVYTLGQSALQMRALVDDAPVAAPQGGRAALTPSAATAPAPDETGGGPDVAAPAASSAAPPAAQDAQRSEGPEAETEAEGSPAGPPSGAEFAALLEGELAGETDPAAVEALRRALRETPAAEE